MEEIGWWTLEVARPQWSRGIMVILYIDGWSHGSMELERGASMEVGYNFGKAISAKTKKHTSIKLLLNP